MNVLELHRLEHELRQVVCNNVVASKKEDVTFKIGELLLRNKRFMFHLDTIIG